jgi:hypothetical protein
MSTLREEVQKMSDSKLDRLIRLCSEELLRRLCAKTSELHSTKLALAERGGQS